MVSRYTRWTCIALLLLAFAARLWGLTDVPPGLNGDESINGSDALQILQGHTPVFFTNNYGREALFLYSMALSLKLFGASDFSIRLTGVWYSFITLPLTFILVKRLWNRCTALFTIALLTFSFWALFIGRTGFRATSMLPFQALTLYAIWRGIFEKSRNWWLLAGLCLGLITYTYIPGRIFPAIPLLWLLSAALTHHKIRTNLAAQLHRLALTGTIALLIFAPFGWFIYQYPELANQRINELTWELNQLRAGNLQPILVNGLLIFKAFTFQGSTVPRYNLPGRPIFDWIIGSCFYLGLLLSLLRWRQPRQQLLLLWGGLMLTPTLVTSEVFTLLRPAGALLPIYILAAIGLEQCWNWTSRTPIPVRSLFKSGIIAALVFSSGQALYDYFHVWPRLPAVRQIYTAGFAQMGAELERLQPLPPNTTVLVGCRYAADLCRDMFRFQTRYTGPIKWFAGQNSLLIPAPGTTHELLYFFSDGLPLPPMSQTVLSTGEKIAAYTDVNGDPESVAYRVVPAWTDLPWQPQYLLNGQFQENIMLLGYDLNTYGVRGRALALTLYWQVPASFVWDNTTPPQWRVSINDALANPWTETGGLLPYAIWDWQSGDLVAQHIDLPLPPDIPPGEWEIELTLFKPDGQLIYRTAEGVPSTTLILAPITLVGTPLEPEPENIKLVGFTAELGLKEIQAPSHLSPGDFIITTASWHTLARPTIDYAIQYQLHANNCTGNIIYQQQEPIWPERHPTSLWEPGEPIRTIQWPQLPPEMPNGSYFLTLALTNGKDVTPYFFCEQLTIQGRPRQFEIPNMNIRLDQEFQNGITLLGYDITLPTATTEPLILTLYWQPQQTLTNWYISFAHLYNNSDQRMIITQHDYTPCNGYCPTTTWLPGEILTDPHPLFLPEDLLAGNYVLGIGLYETETLTRVLWEDNSTDIVIIENITLP